MNLQQLRSLCEIVKQGLHISDAAAALYTSQPGVSRQLRELESELGINIFIRQRNRVVGLTEPGKKLLVIAQRITRDTEDVRHIALDYVGNNDGELMIATTHMHARYALPKFIRQFTTAYPNVNIGLRQGSPLQCYELVASGEADLAIAPEPYEKFESVVTINAYKVARSLVTLSNHPLRKEKKITIQKIAKYPIIAFDSVFRSRGVIENAFAKAGHTPIIRLTVIDADVGKSYVELGLGISILPSIAVNPVKDKGLRAIDVTHLFEPGTMSIALRRNSYLRKYIYDLIGMFAPHLTQSIVDEALSGKSPKVSHRLSDIPFV